MMQSKLWSHFTAILFKRYVQIKRSYMTVAYSIISTVVFSALAILAQFLMKSLIKEDPVVMDFNKFGIKSDQIAYVLPDSETWAQPLVGILEDMFYNDTGMVANISKHTSVAEQNLWLYTTSTEYAEPTKLLYSIAFNDITALPGLTKRSLITFHNSTQTFFPSLTETQAQTSRILWKSVAGVDKDLKVAFVRMWARLMEFIFGNLAPMLIVTGVISIVPLIITQPIIDIRGEVRQYMMSCTLNLSSYWLATFVVDLVIWNITTTIVWLIFIMFQTQSFLDNLFNTWFSFFIAGPSFLLSTYCLSFSLSNPESASRVAFLILIIILLIPMIVDMVRKQLAPAWLEWVYGIFPHIGLFRSLISILSRVSFNSKTLDYYYENKDIHGSFIMPLVNIAVYGGLLYIIEKVRRILERRGAERTFGDYGDFFKKQKEKHSITEEAKKVEEEVVNRHDYAVRIENVSRLFFNTSGEPISAVNDVSLGVDKGSTFGFLGANGAGKTTLIKMITSMMPPSAGTIEINGVDISKYNDPTLLSICPQFNTHLLQEMTPREHFKLFGKLFCYTAEESENKSRVLIEGLELSEHVDTPLRELSDGDVRKLSIALSFFGPATIILLDEPTASLDPVARKKVQDMIFHFKGEKTFMLCTHLLSEAESLCDHISIMIKGCVYTYGTPAYLSAKFGTEYKVDVMIDEKDSESPEHCDKFFAEELPFAQLTMVRPNARIYSIPANEITLPQLFMTMEKGKKEQRGFSYYTCSTSSLERVFMEIVHLSENEDIVYTQNGNNTVEPDAENFVIAP